MLLRAQTCRSRAFAGRRGPGELVRAAAVGRGDGEGLERRSGQCWRRRVGRKRDSYIAQHVLQPLGLPALALRAVFAGVFGVFLAEVQEEFVVCDEC